MKKEHWTKFVFFFISFLCIMHLDGQELIYNSFLVDSIGVGENVDFYITVEQAEEPLVNDIDLQDLIGIKFYPPISSPDDSIVSKKADISINDLGAWMDTDKNGLLQGEEVKWQKIQNGDTILYRNKINISFFDVGLYVFEGFNLTFNNRPAKTAGSMLKVNFKEYDLEVVDSTGLAPIKDIEKESLAFQDILPYLLYLLVPLAILFAFFQYRKYQKKKAAEPVIVEEVIIPPDVIALTSLKDLRNQQLWQKGQIKEYQTQLSHIIREYLEGRYDIKALENTTSQIIKSITDKSFDQDDQVKLKRILQISDLVKFAKAKPNVNIHEEFMDDAISFVQKTRNDLRDENKEEE